MTDIVRQILSKLKVDIIETFKGNKRRKEDDEYTGAFFQANTKKIPPGKFTAIVGKNSNEPRFLKIETLC